MAAGTLWRSQARRLSRRSSCCLTSNVAGDGRMLESMRACAWQCAGTIIHGSAQFSLHARRPDPGESSSHAHFSRGPHIVMPRKAWKIGTAAVGSLAPWCWCRCHARHRLQSLHRLSRLRYLRRISDLRRRQNPCLAGNACPVDCGDVGGALLVTSRRRTRAAVVGTGARSTWGKMDHKEQAVFSTESADSCCRRAAFV